MTTRLQVLIWLMDDRCCTQCGASRDGMFPFCCIALCRAMRPVGSSNQVPVHVQGTAGMALTRSSFAGSTEWLAAASATDELEARKWFYANMKKDKDGYGALLLCAVLAPV